MNTYEMPNNRRLEAARLFNEQDVEETLSALDKLDRAGMGDDTVHELIGWLTALHDRNLDKRDEAA